jgi:hypothetical protein
LGTEEGALEALAQLPWLVEVPPALLLREAVRLSPSSALRTLTLSIGWEGRLERAVALLDRVVGPGAGMTELLAIAWGQHGRGDGRAPYSLGGYAVLLRKRAKAWRRRKGARKPGLADRELARLRAKGLA